MPSQKKSQGHHVACALLRPGHVFLTVGKRGFEYSIPGYPVTLPPGILFHLVKVFGESRFMKTITTSGVFKDFIKKTEIRTLLTSGHWGYL